MNFDPKFVDLGKSGDEIGLIVNPNGGIGPASNIHVHSNPVPFMGIDGEKYVLMPDGKVYLKE